MFGKLYKEKILPKSVVIILILILILAAFLRLYNLGDEDKGINVDEALFGYEAYSILKTGYDHNKTGFLPLYFKGYSEVYDNRTDVLYSYLAIPFVVLGGLNLWSIRLPAASLGILTVFLTYFLTNLIFENKKVALLAAFFLSISPWHLTLSRFALPQVTIPFFITLGFYIFFKGIKGERRYLPFFLLPWALSIYSYQIAKLIIPLLVIAIFIIYRQKIKENKKEFLLSLIFAFLLLLPSIIIHLTHLREIQGRFVAISIFNDSLWYKFFPSNYLLYYLPSLFFLPTLFYFFEYFLLILGIIFIFQRKKKESKVLIFWLIFFPIPAALTIHEMWKPEIMRAISVLPVVQIIGAWGGYEFLNLL